MSRAMFKAQRLNRIEELLLVAPNGLTSSEIAAQLGVHRTTIWRDLQELDSVLPICQDRDRYGIDRASYLTNVRLSVGESLMLHLAMRLMTRRLTHVPDIMLTALEKLGLALRDPVAQEWLDSVARVRGGRPPSDERAQVWETLIRGWLEQIVVRFSYQKFQDDAPTTYELQPYLFEPAVLSEGVYVIGHSLTHGELRTFKVERILHASLTTRTFETSGNLSADELLRHAWGIWYGQKLVEVRLRFREPAVARRVCETLWHPSQRIQALPGSGIEWVVQIAGTTELIPWIRGWGSDVEVVAPDELRTFIAEDMQKAARLYDET